MDAMQCLTTRRSRRSFRSDPVTVDTIRQVLNAGRLAPSARNIQPWEFVVVTDEKTRLKLAQLMEYGKFISQAPVCIVIFCRDTKYYLEDGCSATTNILDAAHALDLAACWVAGDKKHYAEDVRKLLGVPDGYKLVSSIALGKAGQPEPEPAKRPLEEVVHWENF